MPRKSPYSVLLSAKERIELERISNKYTSPYLGVTEKPPGAVARCGRATPFIVL